MQIDLGSLESVRKFVAKFVNKFQVLNYLFNNAGIIANGETDDGFEIGFQIDYLGHFLLTELLLPTLRKNKGIGPSKVVHTTSIGHYLACKMIGVMDKDCLKDWTYLPPPPTKYGITLGIAKFAQIQHA